MSECRPDAQKHDVPLRVRQTNLLPLFSGSRRRTPSPGGALRPVPALHRIRRLEEREAQRKAEEAIMEERRRQLLEEADGCVLSL